MHLVENQVLFCGTKLDLQIAGYLSSNIKCNRLIEVFTHTAWVVGPEVRVCEIVSMEVL